MRWLPPNYLPLLPFSILEGRLLLKVSFPKLLRTTIGYASELCQSLSGISISEADASLLVTDKCKIISFPFGSNPTSPVGHTIMHRYSVLALITTGLWPGIDKPRGEFYGQCYLRCCYNASCAAFEQIAYLEQNIIKLKELQAGSNSAKDDLLHRCQEHEEWKEKVSLEATVQSRVEIAYLHRGQ
ncbi:hypothetical protein M9H77_08654 [Catharanthus roseus]|uniref:Uncharacterized protein n=1 Tax=Catharanthus roseus TaxID=4058 RepID=A0ACC0BYD8_CATRO|nr:hypothetical protein M9H77_08654 [Catharanthus roseus]